MRRLADRQHQLGRLLTKEERIQTVQEASIEVRKPTLFGELIIGIVYLPILTLTGIEGKMFVPMAQVVLLALLGALFLSFTIIPALAALLLRGKISEKEIFIVRWAIYFSPARRRFPFMSTGTVGVGSGSGCGLVCPISLPALLWLLDFANCSGLKIVVVSDNAPRTIVNIIGFRFILVGSFHS